NQGAFGRWRTVWALADPTQVQAISRVTPASLMIGFSIQVWIHGGDRGFSISTIGYGLANLPAGFENKHLCRGVSIELWRDNDRRTL
ncbi:MAG: hypothetical protein LH647_23540, partial [Leptolyngbyaceae cyanobacterium CAN_BIN12]|nr:hypothetical protein [Leptolyngbyaceae cyanobacterium CAN_BIN12]